MSERELAQICYQRPGMDFYFLRLTTNRLIVNASRVVTVEATLLAPPTFEVAEQTLINRTDQARFL
jgi:hypothetical protein